MLKTECGSTVPNRCTGNTGEVYRVYRPHARAGEPDRFETRLIVIAGHIVRGTASLPLAYDPAIHLLRKAI